jgi:hypothetical protein
MALNNRVEISQFFQHRKIIALEDRITDYGVDHGFSGLLGVNRRAFNSFAGTLFWNKYDDEGYKGHQTNLAETNGRC